MAVDEVQALKQRHHVMWATGDYASVAERVEEVAVAIVQAAAPLEGTDLLDVATGTGNAALLAAQQGALVTALDLTPELFDRARERAGALGVEVEWIAGDAEELPFADASFDRVLSSIGIQFAPRHEVVARELVRVLRPGGRFVLGNWKADGMIGEMFKLLGPALPKPPAFASPPPLWGDEAHVRKLFAELPVKLAFEARTARVEFASVDEYIQFFNDNYGPTIKAREQLEPAGKWEPLEAELRALAERFYRGGAVEQSYWVITGDVTS
jgi:ubiquinone/menaquinone biosynthesis C-methylase UbiE